MSSINPTADKIRTSRLFEEPLVAIGSDPSPEENNALASALTVYAHRDKPEDFSSLTGFLESHPNSPWSASLLTNLGLVYYRAARYSKTLSVWREAWELAKPATDPKEKAVADRAFGELVYMHARLGHMAELDR